MKSRIEPLPLAVISLLVICAALLFALIQFATVDFAGTDAYYHSKLASLMGHTPLPEWPISFPWLPNSVLSQERFVDHHFLFHVFMIPFVSSSILFGGKCAAVVFATCVFMAYLWALPRLSTWSLLFAAAAFFSVSSGFLYRMSLVRAQSLSLAVLLMLFVLGTRRKYWAVATLSFLYVWLYNAFPLLIVLFSCMLVAEYYSEGVINRKLLIAPFAGALAGFIVNPYFPKNAVFLYHHLVDKFAPSGYAVAVGNEWYPYSAQNILLHLSVSLLCYFGAIALTILSPTKKSKESLTLLLLGGVFLGMVLKSRRFVELFPPIALLSFIWAASAHGFLSSYIERSVGKRRSWAFYLVTACSLLFLASVTIGSTRDSMKRSKPYSTHQGAMKWLADNSEKGALVVTSDWDMFPRLFHHNSHNTYIAGLDPYFFYAFDRELFELWRRLTKGEVTDTLRWSLEHRFKAQYLYVERSKSRMRGRLEDDPEIEQVYTDRDGSIFVVKQHME